MSMVNWWIFKFYLFSSSWKTFAPDLVALYLLYSKQIIENEIGCFFAKIKEYNWYDYDKSKQSLGSWTNHHSPVKGVHEEICCIGFHHFYVRMVVFAGWLSGFLLIIIHLICSCIMIYSASCFIVSTYWHSHSILSEIANIVFSYSLRGNYVY